jgi:hypothetical protein
MPQRKAAKMRDFIAREPASMVLSLLVLFRPAATAAGVSRYAGGVSVRRLQ